MCVKESRLSSVQPSSFSPFRTKPVLLLVFFILLLFTGCANPRPTTSVGITIPAKSSTPLPTIISSRTFLPSLTPASDCRQSAGTIANRQMNSPTLGKTLHFIVYTPGCYAATSFPLPVMYLLHGQTFDEDQWIRLGATTIADQMVAYKRYPAFHHGHALRAG